MITGMGKGKVLPPAAPRLIAWFGQIVDAFRVLIVLGENVVEQGRCGGLYGNAG